MEFHEVVKTRRSVRTFKPNKPDKDIIARVLDAVRLSPSGSNRQPWRFILVADPEKKAKRLTNHVVKEGDTFAELVAMVYGHTDEKNIQMVKEHNPELSDVNQIKVGQKLKIPE